MYGSDSDEEEVEIEQDETEKQKEDLNVSGQTMQTDDETQINKAPVEKRKLLLPDPDVLLSKKTKPNKMNSLIPPQLKTKRKNIVTESS